MIGRRTAAALVAGLVASWGCGGPGSDADPGRASPEDAVEASATNGPAGDGNKIALVVAIAEYSPTGGWENLSSDRDLQVMGEALASQGFEVLSIADRAATRAGIERAFRDQFLPKVQAGQVALFHYSGHGHQLTDDNGDEVDGYDEVLVPHDAPLEPGAGYDGALHVRDDTLGDWLRELRAKVGEEGEVIVTLDACFSGTGTRGEPRSRARGHKTPIGPPQAATERSAPGIGGRARESSGVGYLEPAPRARGGGAVGESGLAPMVAYSAAPPDELAYEADDENGELVGSLSYAFSSALTEIGPSDSYRSLFEKVKNKMASYGVSNIPQAEGSLDAALFGGRAVEQDPFFRITDGSDDGYQVLLAGGSVVGLTVGTQVEIHPAGTVNWRESEALSQGSVSAVTSLSATVDIDPELYAEEIANAWAYVTARDFGEITVVARLDDSGDSGWGATLAAVIGADPTRLIALDGDPDVIVRQADGGVVVEAVHDGSRLLGPLADDRALTRLVSARLRDYARNRYLRRMELASATLAVDTRLSPCALDCDSFGKCTCTPLSPGACETGGNVVLPEGQGYQLAFENRGREPAYVSVLELMPDGQWSVLWPAAGVTPEPIAVGASFEPADKMWRIAPPYGRNVLKTFASSQPIDFRGLLGSRGGQSRGGNANPLETLFDGLLTPSTRGSESRDAFSADTGVTTSTVTFEIAESRADAPAGCRP